MHEGPFPVRPQYSFEVIPRVGPFVSRGAVPNLQVNDVLVSLIDQLVGNTMRRESRAHAGREFYLLDVGNQSRLPFKDINKFILHAVAM